VVLQPKNVVKMAEESLFGWLVKWIKF